MSTEAVANLREEYSNSSNFSDGEIFRHIRLYHRLDNSIAERKWWARLTKDKAKDLKRILNIKALREGFDDLLDITGLWDAFHIGTMRRYLVLKCHEVVIATLKRPTHADDTQELAIYLRRIRHVWSRTTS